MTGPQRRRTLPTRFRAPAIVLIAALITVACGSDDSGGAGFAPDASPDVGLSEPDPAGDDPGSGEAEGTDPASPAAGAATAVVDLGGTTYEFNPEFHGSCQIDENGIFRASVVNEDFSSIEVSLPPEGFVPDGVLFAADEYPKVIVRLGETAEWSADAYESDPLSTSNRNIPEGQTQVDSFRFDAAGASGDATFVDLESLTYHQDGGFYSGEPVSGSFEVSCG